MTREIEYVDICGGLAWGDEAKGKIVSYLSKSGKYDLVCRWGGGNNAGHTIYLNQKKYKTHLIPSGIFYQVTSIIGPGCVINEAAFLEEIAYLKENNFDTSLVKISPKAHVVLQKHIEEEKKEYLQKQGTTCRGIAPCYSDKYQRIGIQAKDVSSFKQYLWDEKLYGKILCEGAQGFWLDINRGNYPYVTSSTTIPYDACSLGFPPQYIRNIYGASKIYDTRAGTDPDFPFQLLTDPELIQIGDVGEEYGTTTGRKRKVNYLNLDKLCEAIYISGTTHLIISKIDVLEKVNIFKCIYHKQIITFNTISELKDFINQKINIKNNFIKEILYSGDMEGVTELLM
jgi:adenylosuccinate synthase